MALKETEELAAEALQQLLLQSGVHSTWTSGSNPPDLVFSVAGERWAVEETQLHQYLATRGQPLEAASLLRSFGAMCQRIDERVRPTLTASYLIMAFMPVTRPRLDEIETRALQYIASRKSAATQLDDMGRVQIGVDHRAAPGSYRVRCWIDVLPGVLAADGQSSSMNARVNVEQALGRILEEKIPRLENLVGYDRRLLIITKSYPRAELPQLKEVLAGLLARHTRSVAALDAVLFLFQRDEAWDFLGEYPDEVDPTELIVHRRGDLHVLATPSGWTFARPANAADIAR